MAHHAQSALDKLITISDIDARLSVLFAMRMRPTFDPVAQWGTSQSAICSESTQAVAADGAAQGTTLLKNLDATLPLKPEDTVASSARTPSSRVASYYGPATSVTASFIAGRRGGCAQLTHTSHGGGCPEREQQQLERHRRRRQPFQIRRPCHPRRGH